MASQIRKYFTSLVFRKNNSWLSSHNGLCSPIFSNFHTSSTREAVGLPVRMPSLSPTMTEGNIVKWLKKEGDKISAGDVLCDIQTDKAVISFETEDDGILAKILVQEDVKVIKIGTLIALTVEEGEDWQNVEMPEEESEAGIDAEQTSPAEKASPSIQHNFGPSVRLLLEKYGLSSDEVPAEGPHGVLLKGDVLKFIKEKNLVSKPTAKVELPPAISAKGPEPSAKPPVKVVSGDSYDDIELTNMRKTIAKRLLQSKSMFAHTYSTLDCCIGDLLKLRKQFKNDGTAVSVNDFIIKAVGVALRSCPEVNCVWEGNQLVHKSEVDISIAVASDAGLITPIVKGVQRLGLEEISGTVKNLAMKARENKLKLDEYQGGTFTISNLGMFGITEFTAIINPPQCAILAVGGGRQELTEKGTVETRMMATLSYDQAAISDDMAAIFMGTLKDLLENPQSMLLGSTSKKVNHPMAALL